MNGKFKIWDKESITYHQGGQPQTKEDMFNTYGWMQNPECTVVLFVNNDGVVLAVDPLGVFCERLGIERAETPEETVTKLNERYPIYLKEQEDQANTPSAEERIAAAMEFQNLMNL